MYARYRGGWIEVICGPMFSGKSEELIRRLRRAIIAGQRVQVFKPVIDDRYSKDEIVSHSELKLKAIPVRNSRELLDKLDGRTEVIGIDEVQFFDSEIVKLVERLANIGKRVIVAGLDLDYKAEPFEIVMKLMALAEDVTKTLAVCSKCGAPASRTQRLLPSKERIVVGAADIYEPRCRMCYDPDIDHRFQLDFILLSQIRTDLSNKEDSGSGES